MGLVAGVQLILPLHQPQLQIKAVHFLILNYQEYAYSSFNIFFITSGAIAGRTTRSLLMVAGRTTRSMTAEVGPKQPGEV